MTPQEINLSPCACGRIECAVQYSRCHCGCGAVTAVSQYNVKSKGLVAGRHKLHLVGHANRVIPIPENATPFKIDGVYCRLIALTQEQYTIVNESDYLWLMQWKWQARRSRKNGKHYAARTVSSEGKSPTAVLMHRAILELDPEDSHQGDHIETGKTLDNRRANLRVASPSQNGMNKQMRSDNTTGLKGVVLCLDKFRNKPWLAQIGCYGKRYRLGRFRTKEEAHAAYCRAAAEMFGGFARTE